MKNSLKITLFTLSLCAAAQPVQAMNFAQFFYQGKTTSLCKQNQKAVQLRLTYDNRVTVQENNLLVTKPIYAPGYEEYRKPVHIPIPTTGYRIPFAVTSLELFHLKTVDSKIKNGIIKSETYHPSFPDDSPPSESLLNRRDWVEFDGKVKDGITARVTVQEDKGFVNEKIYIPGRRIL